MPTDKRFQVLENIKDTFDLITTAGGYNTDPGYKGIGIKHYTEIPEDKFPALMVAGADEDRQNGTNMTFTSGMEVSIVGYVKSSDALDPEIAERDLSRVIADLTKALLVDHTRGGLCKFTEIGTVRSDKGFIQPYAAFELIAQVEYRSNFSQP